MKKQLKWTAGVLAVLALSTLGGCGKSGGGEDAAAIAGAPGAIIPGVPGAVGGCIPVTSPMNFTGQNSYGGGQGFGGSFQIGGSGAVGAFVFASGPQSVSGRIAIATQQQGYPGGGYGYGAGPVSGTLSLSPQAIQEIQYYSGCYGGYGGQYGQYGNQCASLCATGITLQLSTWQQLVYGNGILTLNNGIQYPLTFSYY